MQHDKTLVFYGRINSQAAVPTHYTDFTEIIWFGISSYDVLTAFVGCPVIRFLLATSDSYFLMVFTRTSLTKSGMVMPAFFASFFKSSYF